MTELQQRINMVRLVDEQLPKCMELLETSNEYSRVQKIIVECTHEVIFLTTEELKYALNMLKYLESHIQGFIDKTLIQDLYDECVREDRIAARNGKYRRKIQNRRFRYDS